MTTVRLTAAQAMVKYLAAQLNEAGEPFLAGIWAIFGHGNVAGIGEALYAERDRIQTYRGHNEQTMCHAAIAYAKQSGRRRAMAVTSSICCKTGSGPRFAKISPGINSSGSRFT